MSASQLSRNAVRRMFDGSSEKGVRLQVLDTSPMNASNAGKSRYKIVISDGDHYAHALLATQMNHFIDSGQLNKLSIIHIDEFVANTVKDKPIIVIVNLIVIESHVSQPIGKPQNIDTAALQQSSAQMPNYGGYGQQQPQGMRGYGAVMNTGYGAPPNTGGGGGSFGGTGPVSSNTQRATININDLNPYMSTWTIKARVTAKGNMRTWSNARGDGKLFSVDLLDAAGGEIRATMFNDAADRLTDIFQEGQVYLIGRGQIKVANKQWTHLKNDYELTLNRDAEVTHVQEDKAIQQQRFEFVPISSIEQIEKDAYIDLCAVATAVQPLSTIVSSKTQKELQKRTVTLLDQTNKTIDLTLWGADAEKYTEDMLSGTPIIAIKGCRVGDYGGRSLSTVMSSQVVLRPDLPEAHQLQNWFEQRGNNAPTAQSLSRGGGGSFANAEPKTCADIDDEQLGIRNMDKPDIISLTGAITVLQFNQERLPWYLACPSPDCKKKVSDTGSGQWYCEKCSKAYATCLPRFIMSFVVSDNTGSQWVSAFNDVCESILQNSSADNMRTQFENGDIAGPQSLFRRSNFKEYTFVIRAKGEIREEQTQVRCNVISATPVDYAAQAHKTLQLIRAFA